MRATSLRKAKSRMRHVSCAIYIHISSLQKPIKRTYLDCFPSLTHKPHKPVQLKFLAHPLELACSLLGHKLLINRKLSFLATLKDYLTRP